MNPAELPEETTCLPVIITMPPSEHTAGKLRSRASVWPQKNTKVIKNIFMRQKILFTSLKIPITANTSEDKWHPEKVHEFELLGIAWMMTDDSIDHGAWIRWEIVWLISIRCLGHSAVSLNSAEEENDWRRTREMQYVRFVEFIEIWKHNKSITANCC